MTTEKSKIQNPKSKIAPGEEIEVKLRCDGIATLERAGMKLELLQARHFEENWLFDTPDRQLGSRLAVLRVRAVEDSGTLTYKAPPAPNAPVSQFKKRIEIETTVGDAQQMVAILVSLGYQRWFNYQKYRTVYKVLLPHGSDLLAMVDETPLGNFVELEGEEEAIAAAVTRMGVTPDQYVLLSYLALQSDRCRLEGRPLEDLVFS